MSNSVGELPVSFRQTTTATLTGVAPVGAAAKAYDPVKFTGGRYDYVDPDDHSLNDLTAGGKFDFENDDPLRVVEVRCIGTDVGAVTIEDKVGTFSSIVSGTITKGTILLLGGGVILLPSQYVKVTMAGAGAVEIYVVKADYL